MSSLADRMGPHTRGADIVPAAIATYVSVS